MRRDILTARTEKDGREKNIVPLQREDVDHGTDDGDVERSAGHQENSGERGTKKRAE